MKSEFQEIDIALIIHDWNSIIYWFLVNGIVNRKAPEMVNL